MPCECYEAGSVDKNCNNDGQCTCKPGFKGIKCTDRDCVLSAWRATSNCKCPGKTISQERDVKTQPHGNVAKCGNLSREVSCSILCAPKDCTQHEFGPHCEHQNCTVGPWSDSDGSICYQKNEAARMKGKWDKCLQSGSRSNIVKMLGWEYYYHAVTYKRTRKVLFERKGKGKQCPRLTQYVTCKYKTCEHQFWRHFG